MREWHWTRCGLPGKYHGMNRIREIREQKGISQSALADLCNTTQPTIQRLESGDRKLTEFWMRAIAKALDVRPVDLIEAMNAAEIEDDIAPDVDGDADILRPLAAMGLAAYRVLTDCVALTGIQKGDRIVVDATLASISSPKIGSVVVADVERPSGDYARILRQFIPPALIVSNRPGQNVVMSLDDPSMKIRITGIVRRA